MNTASKHPRRPVSQRTIPLRCEHTARQIAALAREVVEALEAARAEEDLIAAYAQAAAHHVDAAKRRE